jgi:hypothetical protein
MGDFDRRHEKPATNDQSKQITLMIVLGLVLTGVLGYHFMKSGPQPAKAAPAGMGGIPVPIIEETPEQASDLLRQDPTAALLRPTAAVDDSLNKLPRNPFLISEQWRASLVTAIEPAVTPTAAPAVVTPRPITVRAIPVPKAEHFKLGSTMRQGGGYVAIVNGRIVTVGGLVGDARVLDIQEGRVVLQHSEYPEGPKLELTMEPKLK